MPQVAQPDPELRIAHSEHVREKPGNGARTVIVETASRFARDLMVQEVGFAKLLRRKRPKGGQRSLRDIAAELAQRGIMNERGVPF